MMTRRQRLALRGAGASFTANLVAAVSHTVGGEQAPAPLIVVGMMALLWPPAMLLMGSRPRPGRIAATVIVAQAAFHTVYAALGFPSSPALGGAAGHGGHGGHAHLTLGVGAAVDISPLMVGAHVVAAAVTFAVLVFGERTIDAIRSWTIATLRARITTPRPRIAPAVLLGVGVAFARPERRAFALIGPRGPPHPSL